MDRLLDAVFLPWSILFQVMVYFQNMINIKFQRIFFKEIHDRYVSKRQSNLAYHMYTFLRMAWILSTFLLVAAYNGNLRASLIIPTYEKMPQSIDEIVERFVFINFYSIHRKLIISPQCLLVLFCWPWHMILVKEPSLAFLKKNTSSNDIQKRYLIAGIWLSTPRSSTFNLCDQEAFWTTVWSLSTTLKELEEFTPWCTTTRAFVPPLHMINMKIIFTQGAQLAGHIWARIRDQIGHRPWGDFLQPGQDGVHEQGEADACGQCSLAVSVEVWHNDLKQSHLASFFTILVSFGIFRVEIMDSIYVVHTFQGDQAVWGPGLWIWLPPARPLQLSHKLHHRGWRHGAPFWPLHAIQALEGGFRRTIQSRGWKWLLFPKKHICQKSFRYCRKPWLRTTSTTRPSFASSSWGSPSPSSPPRFSTAGPRARGTGVLETRNRKCTARFSKKKSFIFQVG